ncbi:hypothetical protein PV703_24900 [Streptomyces sp. ME01-24h]|nr:hypothetical protein [Streptomyces sp. ME19-03-3]MDX3356486.1 hypothetical protein [Streptomyces sp. ME01-24h]
MGYVGGIWRLLSDGEPVGVITVEEADFPWLSGRFTPGPAFARVRPLFARELALMQTAMTAPAEEDEPWAAWEAAYEEVRRTVTLHSPSGPVAEFLLHVEGDQAWFRWSEEPFDDDSPSA